MLRHKPAKQLSAWKGSADRGGMKEEPLRTHGPCKEWAETPKTKAYLGPSLMEILSMQVGPLPAVHSTQLMLSSLTAASLPQDGKHF